MEFKNKTVNLFGSIWKIRFVEDIEREDGVHPLGLTCYETNTIKVRTINFLTGRPLPKNEVELTFLHELMHAVLSSGQYNACSEDEPLVEWLARSIKILIDKNII